MRFYNYIVIASVNPSILQAWSQVVPIVQRLPNQERFNLVRLLCNLPPHKQPVRPDVSRIAEMLQAISMEITQRRSFLERYSRDLQQALDAHSSASHTPQRKATFSAPPGYTGSTNQQSPGSGDAPAYEASAPSDDEFKMILIRETFVFLCFNSFP